MNVSYPRGSVPVWFATQPMGGTTGPRYLTAVPRVGDTVTMDESLWEVRVVHHEVAPEGDDRVARVVVTLYHLSRMVRVPPG